MVSQGTGFHHDALFYETDEEFVSTLVPWLLEGLALDHGTAVVTTASRIASLREALGADAQSIFFAVDEEWYTTPASAIARWNRVGRRSAADGLEYTRIIGELPFVRTSDEQATWARFESAVNYAFAGAPSWNICPYNLRLLPEHVIENAWRTHPTVWDGYRSPSDAYTVPSEFFVQIPEPEPVLGAEPFVRMALGREIAELRQIATQTGERAGLPSDRVQDLVLAFSEVATNAMLHGGGITNAAMWIDRDGVVCEVSDDRGDLTDPLAGFVPPAPEGYGGRGLWLARQLSKWLVIDTDHGRGTTIRFAVTAD